MDVQSKKDVVKPDPEDFRKAEQTTSKTENTKKGIDHLYQKFVDLNNSVSVDLDKAKAKEIINSFIEKSKDGVRTLAQETKTFMIEHDVVGKLKNGIKAIFKVIYLIFKWVFVIIFILF